MEVMTNVIVNKRVESHRVASHDESHDGHLGADVLTHATVGTVS